MQGLALTTEQIIEILSAYSSSKRLISAVAVSPGWNVLGAFRMPATADVLLSGFGSVSDPDLTMHVRVYCITPGFVGPVAGSTLQITSLTDVRALSGIFTLPGNLDYQFQAEVVGDVGDDQFGAIEAVCPQGSS